MKLTPKIQKAINLATKLHCDDGAVRKGIKLPYIVHPFSVAWIVASYTDNEDAICAALMHDTLEDIDGYEYENLKADLGETIADLVNYVTEVKNDEQGNKRPWKIRKEDYLERLKEAPKGSLYISAADKIHNLNSMIEAYKAVGKKSLEEFNDNGGKFWYYKSCLEIISKNIDSPITKELEETIVSAEKTFGSEIKKRIETE